MFPASQKEETCLTPAFPSPPKTHSLAQPQKRQRMRSSSWNGFPSEMENERFPSTEKRIVELDGWEWEIEMKVVSVKKRRKVE